MVTLGWVQDLARAGSVLFWGFGPCWGNHLVGGARWGGERCGDAQLPALQDMGTSCVLGPMAGVCSWDFYAHHTPQSWPGVLADLNWPYSHMCQGWPGGANRDAATKRAGTQHTLPVLHGVLQFKMSLDFPCRYKRLTIEVLLDR